MRASQHGFRSRAEDSVATDFGGTAWKHVLEEAADEFDSRQSDALHLLGAVIAVAEADHAIVDRFDAAVGDRNAEDIAAQVVENLVAAAGVLGMNDPFFLPDRYGRAGEQSRPFQSRAELRAKDHRQSADGDKKSWMFGLDPGLCIRREAAGSDQHVNMWVKQHGARPGVKDGKNTKARAQKLGIGRQLLQGIGGGLHQQAVDFLGMGSCEWA